MLRLPPDQFRARGYKAIPTPFFLLKIKKNQGAAVRAGIVAGVAVHKSAVKRNFWRRQARAEIALRAKGGYDILMVLSPAVNRITKKQFRAAVAKALATAR